jgi:trk system potassium uptake protein TrkA
MEILILGAGDIGFQLGKRLSQEKYDITMIECDPAKVKRASEQLDAIVVEGHAASYRVLSDAGLARKSIVAAMTNNDEVNLLACMIAKKMGDAVTIARVRNPELTEEDFALSRDEMGVDHIIHPEQETALAIVRLIRQATATDVIELEEGKIQIVGVRVEMGSRLLRKPLFKLAQDFGDPPMRVVAINRNQRTLIPRGDNELIPGDHIFAVCTPDYIEKFIEATGKQDLEIQDMMILGGGLVGQFVARNLSDKINVKVIESNAEKSREIANALPNTLIIQGDGTDLDLMAVEGLQDMDAFVAVTGDDETNIISTLVARHLKVPRTIALVNTLEYLPITPTIGMDAVVSKQLLTVNAVHRFIQHQEIAAYATIPGINVHIIEYIAKKGKITRKPIKDLHFPPDAIIGAVMHEDEMTIPKGDTMIRPGDRVVIFTTPASLHEVQKFFK